MDFDFTICITTIGRASLHTAAQFALAAIDRAPHVCELLIVDDRKEHERDTQLSLPSDTRIRIVRGRALGWCGPARNTGLMTAASPWVLFCDDDDILHPNCILWLKEQLELVPKLDVLIWRAAGRFDHVPHDFAIPPRNAVDLQRGLVCNSLCIRRDSKLRYGEDIMSHWIKPGFRDAQQHRHRETMAPDDDFQFLLKAVGDGAVVAFSSFLAYGVQQPPPLESPRFPLLILR